MNGILLNYSNGDIDTVMAQNNDWYPQPDKRKGHRIASLPSDKRHLKSTRPSSIDKSIESIVSSISRSNIEKWINVWHHFIQGIPNQGLLTRQPIG
jgi:hypothetical protein